MNKKWILGIGILTVIAVWLVFLTIAYATVKDQLEMTQMQIRILEDLYDTAYGDHVYESHGAWFEDEEIFCLPSEN